ncbi:hypothetical protein J5U22_02198 [Saccharolobus shibatae]|uniref:Uncharacterized protein n=1 Tax=Saccharolobus shibatae TaxID=2286 RepID=A0A8F5C236_9CREN|nr:hypothetical protein J5U22_02198 [Saccharolobus shibatae]
MEISYNKRKFLNSVSNTVKFRKKYAYLISGKKNLGESLGKNYHTKNRL